MNKPRDREFQQLAQELVIVKLNPKVSTSRGQVLKLTILLHCLPNTWTKNTRVQEVPITRGTGWLKAWKKYPKLTWGIKEGDICT